ncbi:MAG TPA: response regulator, partial [Campylobacterales bacterium]|nr:response regulator [Campylobacterales bacterium]
MKIKSKIPIKLLYVEDESIIREQLGQLLGRIVKEVISASDGEEGLKAFLEYAPEMIVTDINMPRLNGLDMAKEIRKYDKNIPIIITTAHSESEFLLEAIEVGVSDFLLKPVDIDNLVKVIERKSHDIILEKELQKQQRRFETILNLQEDLIILTSGMDIIEVNKSFLEFFDAKDIEEFKKVYGSIESQMIGGDGDSICKIDGEEWIKNLLSGRFDRNIAKITNKKTGKLQTFMVKAAKFL